MRLFLGKILIKLKIIKYKILSSAVNVVGTPNLIGPVLISGAGKIKFKNNVTLGTVSSPFFYSSYIYIEARRETASIIIEDNVFISNNASIIAEASSIYIGRDSLIGVNFSVMDSNFHGLMPDERMTGQQLSSAVIIESNVFIGANVTILKGVTIGENSVIGSDSVVSKSIPKNVIAAGNPCKVIKDLI